MTRLDFNNLEDLELEMDSHKLEYMSIILDSIEEGVFHQREEAHFTKIYVKDPPLWWEIIYPRQDWIELLEDLEEEFVKQEMYEECARIINCIKLIKQFDNKKKLGEI